MSSRLRALTSSVGTKLLIGITGFALVLYLLLHIAGNLLILGGPALFNRYAYTLEGNPLLPIVELGLLAIFLIHIIKTVGMFLQNRRARPVRYVQKKYAGPPSRKTFASSTMIFSGLWLLVFLVVHVKQFRYGTEYEWPAGGRDLYRLEMENLYSPLIVTFYLLSMAVVGSHLWHGISSSLQSLGTDMARRQRSLLVAGKGLAVLIAGGFVAIAAWVHLRAHGLL
jgi:succinate dehydrogenase / fumarate reductase, cytochrome b subunit